MKARREQSEANQAGQEEKKVAKRKKKESRDDNEVVLSPILVHFRMLFHVVRFAYRRKKKKCGICSRHNKKLMMY
jgi:hypothetical protein